jgi:hypothetical protein
MLVGVLAAVAAALPAAGLTVVPNDGGPFTSFTAVTINAGLGDQLDAHVSGDIAAYTNGTQIDYYDFFSGAHGSVPFPARDQELLGRSPT